MFEQCKGNQGLNSRLKAQGSAENIFLGSWTRKIVKID